MTDAKWTLTQIYNIVLPEGVVPADDQEALNDVLAVVSERERYENMPADEYIGDNLSEVVDVLRDKYEPDEIYASLVLVKWAKEWGLVEKSEDPPDMIKCWNCGEHNGVDVL